MGNQFSFVSIARNNGIPRISVGNSMVSHQEVTNVTPMSNRTQGVLMLGRLPAPFSQLEESLDFGLGGHRSLDSKISRELHCQATFLPESLCFQDLSLGWTIDTAWHSRRLYILDDHTSSSSISRTSLQSSYFSTSEHDFMLRFVCLLGILFTNAVINVITRRPGNTVTIDVTFYEDWPYFPISHLQGEREILERKLDPLLVSHRLRITGTENPVEPCINSTMSENDRSCTKHSISNYVSYENLSPQFRAFTANLDSTTIPKNIYIALECPEWKNAFMEGMKAFEKNNTWEICALPKGISLQFMQAPSEEHMEAVKRILRYLKTTPGKGLMFRKIDRKTIEAYTDFDWAGSVVDRKSTFGYCTFVWGNLVTLMSKKQSVVARSNAEVEYRAMSLGICEEILLQKVLFDLHQECETPLNKLFCDNKTAISTAYNPIQYDEIDRHFIKERLNSGSICISYIPSSQQVTNILTKGLLRPNFEFCVSKLGLIDI
ncbi:Cysteine-rich RLK (receptor-like protein kinase) 8 [Cucumis melo var. makuwa]|uniref:Cysteine-rich RLK (Receptor-like protein kinase) 8 n=1 Tax=Cucumis melo var. makuwa TaxID=1194695 RepID=A0A5D3E4A5_CUCMM|nr:Cysteine-rich RLK (receptor-like protein kinase) 8 [Cucumis melo var. makuwa]TYK30734.1 Cysteine-rich RLK (receptor-like protein kinase) 8 [Cucumis melo var. makuwa]